MQSPYVRIADRINTHPWLVAVIIAAAFVFVFFGTTMLTMEIGTETYMDMTTPQGVLLDAYSDTFGADVIMLVIEADDVTDPLVLEYIDQVEEDIRNEPCVEEVSGLVDMVKQVNGGRLPTSNADIIRAQERISPDLLARFVPSELMTISVVTLAPGTPDEMQYALIDAIETIVEIAGAPAGVSVTVTGEPAFQKQMGEEIGSSMGVLIVAAMALMVIAVGLLFSHVRYRFLPVVVVACGLLATFGIMGWLGIPISMVVVGAFPVLIGIGIDYAIQFHSRLDEEVKKTSLPEAVKTTLTRSGPAVFFAMIATSLGFIAMFANPVPMVQAFGLTCTIGVFSCYSAALLIVPTFGTLIRYRPKTEKKSRTVSMDSYDRLLGNLALKIARNPLVVILALGFIALVGIQLDQTIPINTNEDTFVPSDMPAVVDLNKVTRTMGSTMTLPVYVRGEEVTDIGTLRWLHEFGDYVTTRHDRITGAASIATVMMQYNDEVLPATEPEVDAVLARIPEETRSRYLNGNMNAVVEFSMVDMENEAALSLVEQIEKDIEWTEPPVGISATPTGQLDMFTSLIEDIQQGKTTMTLLGFGLIFAFLLLVYRRITAVSPLVPIVMIVGWNGAIMYVLGIDYSPMTAALGSMSIGVASEYTILIMERCLEERARGLDIFASIQQSVSKIGTAVTVSGATTVFGFSALLLSTFNIVKNFGVVTVITVGFSLIGAIIVMPAVLSLMGTSGRCDAKDAGSAEAGN